MSPAQKAKGKLSRVTFNAAMSSVLPVFDTTDAKGVYRVVSAYLAVWMEHLKRQRGEAWIANPILFRAILSLFQDVAQRVTDRFGRKYSISIVSRCSGHSRRCEPGPVGARQGVLLSVLRRTFAAPRIGGHVYVC